MVGYFWSEEELEMLENHYPTSTKEEMEKLLPKRTYKAIGVKAAKMGVTKTPETHKKIRKIFGDNQRGELNHRFGKQYKRKKFPCEICGEESEYDNKFVKEIEEGKRSPACSNECSVIYARKHINAKNTSIEIKMAEELDSRGIRYEEQYRVGVFTSDFFLPDYNIIIECDGDYWHRKPDVIERDGRKNDYILGKGYSLYRFWESEINTDVGACVDVVLAEINESEEIA